MESILVPTDGSRNATVAVDHAVALATRLGASIRGLYVTHVPSYIGIEAGIDMDAVRSAFEAEGEAALEAVRSRCKRAGVPVTTETRMGRPARQIREAATDAQVDLVVMGTHGRSGVSRLLLGSVTESVLRGVEVPVLVIPSAEAPEPDDYDRILVATDASEGSRAATNMALELAGSLGTELHGLYVLDDRLSRAEVVERALEGEGANELADLEREAESRGVSFISAIETGLPHESIRDYAADHDVDFVVMGSHGRDVIDRAVLGSVSERVVRTASRPVLVVRSAEDAE